MKAYHLTFKSSLHVGTGDDDGNNQTGIEDLLHSDTIFGAIMSCLALLGNDDIESYYKNPPVLVSSAFPFLNGQRFYPLPLGSLKGSVENDSDDMKFWKKVKFIPEEIFIKWLGTGKIDIELFKKKFKTCYTSKGSVGYCVEQERPRLAIDPLWGSVEEGKFFYSKDRFFISGCGLFFLAHFTDKNFEQKFNAAIALLSENGFGADRRIGRGHFACKAHDDLPPALKMHEKQTRGLLLSLYFPSEEEIKKGLLKKSKYTLIRRGGFAADFRNAGKSRDPLMMLGEGSLIDCSICSGGSNEIVLAANNDAAFNTYRYGRGFIIGVNEVKNG